MRLTLKKYEAAKKALKDAEAHNRAIKDWEDAINRIGNMGNQKVTVIKIADDGKITMECEANGKPKVEAK